MSRSSVGDALAMYRFRWTSEDELQAGVCDALREAGFDPKREVRLSSRDVIDVVVGRTGIECKVGRPGNTATPERVTKQLSRYAEHPDIDELILVSTSPRHARIPTLIGGVPVRVLIIGGLGGRR